MIELQLVEEHSFFNSEELKNISSEFFTIDVVELHNWNMYINIEGSSFNIRDYTNISNHCLYKDSKKEVIINICRGSPDRSIKVLFNSHLPVLKLGDESNYVECLKLDIHQSINFKSYEYSLHRYSYSNVDKALKDWIIHNKYYLIPIGNMEMYKLSSDGLYTKSRYLCAIKYLYTLQAELVLIEPNSSLESIWVLFNNKKEESFVSGLYDLSPIPNTGGLSSLFNRLYPEDLEFNKYSIKENSKDIYTQLILDYEREYRKNRL